jgi:hypothetical protein
MKTYEKLKQEITEATKWKKGDGRPRNGSHIENVKFWDLPDASLKYIMKDANAAVKANPEGKKAGKYADEVNDAATVMYWRKKNKIVVEDADLNEGEKLVGWIAIFQGKKLEIKLDKDADSLYGAKKFAIKHFKVPKSKMGLLAIEPGYE